MTHREFLLWLQPHLAEASSTGLARDGVRAIRDRLKRMRKDGPLQPFASRLLAVVREHTALDAKTVASLAAEVRSELAPPREQTVVMSASPAQHEK
jgi:hypothetical protein